MRPTIVIRSFAWLALACLISACGFKLAGSDALPPELSSIYLVTSNFNESQEQALRDGLVRAGARLSPQPDNDILELAVNLEVLPDRRLVSSAKTGKIVERLTRGLEYSLKRADGSLAEAGKSLRQQYDIRLDDDNLLASAQERQIVIRDLEQSLFNRLILQLKRR